MEHLYLYMLVALAFLAITDLVVGVSNDAVNFLNSALGSKAVSFKTIMITASIGIAFGAIFSSGLMEVARKGIFNPEQFMFSEIMIVFMAVMITDILLLDFFNTVGMPTSTTVSIVFELLGASVAMALIKMNANGIGISQLGNYINSDKATQIILGILLSVGIAFTIGAVVQFITRSLLTFNFENKAKWVGAFFGSLALTAITYFIFMKGIKGTSFANQSYHFIDGATIKDFLESQVLMIVAISLTLWFFIAYALVIFAKANIYRIIIVVGTFALALAFAGNDLVNFIGVPIAAYQSFEIWSGTGIAANAFSMEMLSKKVDTPTIFLLLAGLVMIVTLWTSKKSRSVTETEINLARQNSGTERFQPNFLSRLIVRFAIGLNKSYQVILPSTFKEKIEKQFQKIEYHSLNKKDTANMPAFDMARASVNLMVASVLISIATSMKLPLSTTYVTFMVAMGTSLADRAWGTESAVYRVAGVLNVIGGWFFTAFIAFVASATIVYLIQLNVPIMLTVLLVVAVLLIGRNFIVHRKKMKETVAKEKLRKAESNSTQGVIFESATNIANVIKRGTTIYSNTVRGLALQKESVLRQTTKKVMILSEEIENLNNDIYFFIKNLDEPSTEASNFYINILGYLQDMVQSLDYITKASYKHLNNNHRKLSFNQIRALQILDENINALYHRTATAFESHSFKDIVKILESKQDAIALVNEKIQNQIERTRIEETSPKNTTLFFSLLTETRDLLNATMQLLDEYYSSYDESENSKSVKN